MSPPKHLRVSLRFLLALILVSGAALVALHEVRALAGPPRGRPQMAAPALTQLSADPYINASSQHQTEVEPDNFAWGSTIVNAFQVGRFANGGASAIGWATSTDSGATWQHGFLPEITTYQDNGPYDRASDPVVAYDAKHEVWLIASLPIHNASFLDIPAVLVSRSTDSGSTWGNPITVTSGGNLDKDWTVCDNTATSPYFGHCYTEWDAPSSNNVVQMATSTDGGLTWSAAKTTADSAAVIGGQPLVQPNGTVVVPTGNGDDSQILAFTSTNGGASWSKAVLIANVALHTVNGNLRTEALPSADVDASGKVYVVWQDCRFVAGCAFNDLVLSASQDGITWTRPARIPIDGLVSTADHFIPGLGIDHTTSGANAHLALTYYYYPQPNCSATTCQLDVGYITSINGGGSWSAKMQLAGPMNLAWIPTTTGGPMVGDYISTAIAANGLAYPVFPVASSPTGSAFTMPMVTTVSGLPVPGGSMRTILPGPSPHDHGTQQPNQHLGKLLTAN